MTTTSPQEAFLQAFHAEYPAVTSEAFGRGRAPDGRSSYEILCDRVAGSTRVLDLGCGDGVLLELLAKRPGGRPAGVDLSPHSLARARRRPALSRATLAAGRAQELPFADDSFDACVSHLALMLMSEIEQVAAEVARVLSPGGVLACAVGGGAVGGEAYERFLTLLRRTVEQAPASQRIPAMGDRRTRDRDGLDAVLGPAGFAAVDWETVPIDLSGPVEQVWAAVSGLYDLGPLDPPTVERLREAFLAEAADLTTPDGRVPCGFRIHLATTHLR
ncbi:MULTISPECIES: class I SAM-dependent methyltransferase [unclassified Streptomyces]|uniref:class I SAM-dependent methyltransferase n=2 Tax=Streptomyces TaxID=1883 RepID=UPI0005EC27D8|nr:MULTISPECIES: class I SAM-dependent methyltransferase [unclassified Streptomyces]APU38625.1 SAM-dependent methyltransferase [Streptomyces sp. TN58]KJK52719.1 ubiquinone biosynthesis protein UbiE [Streptomyces sp. NRRL F-4428]